MQEFNQRNLEYIPIFYNNSSEVSELIFQKPYITMVDAFEAQLKELFIIENPIYAGLQKKEGYSTEKFQKFCDDKKEDFIYVYYPWNGQLVKTIKKDEYFKLKTNRNQDLITFTEQVKLSKCKVAVFGMSVGSNVALVLTQAGISNDIVIADFDTLDTTNLNRIISGIHNIGLGKCMLAARRIYEDNPYANVTLLNEGVTESNLQGLLEKNNIDIIVEEVDSLPAKILTRSYALKFKIPVIMVTDNGDGVVLHIERYDLGYDKIFNKPFDYWEQLLHSKLTIEEMGKVITNDVLGGINNVSERVLLSVGRIIKHELVSWAQLGSAALLGGVVATIAIKKILIEKDVTPYVEKNIQIDF